MRRSNPRSRDRLCPRRLPGRRRISDQRLAHHSPSLPRLVRSQISHIHPTSSSLLPTQTQHTTALRIPISLPSLRASSHSSLARSKATLVPILSRLSKGRRASNTSPSPYSPMLQMGRPSMVRQEALRSSLPINAFRSRLQDRILRVCTHRSKRATSHILPSRSIRSTSASHRHLKQASCCLRSRSHPKTPLAFIILPFRHHSIPNSPRLRVSGPPLSSNSRNTRRLAPTDLAAPLCIRT